MIPPMKFAIPQSSATIDSSCSGLSAFRRMSPIAAVSSPNLLAGRDSPYTIAVVSLMAGYGLSD